MVDLDTPQAAAALSYGLDTWRLRPHRASVTIQEITLRIISPWFPETRFSFGIVLPRQPKRAIFSVLQLPLLAMHGRRRESHFLAPVSWIFAAVSSMPSRTVIILKSVKLALSTFSALECSRLLKWTVIPIRSPLISSGLMERESGLISNSGLLVLRVQCVLHRRPWHCPWWTDTDTVHGELIQHCPWWTDTMDKLHSWLELR